MLSRRTFLGRLSASLPLLAVPGALRAQGARPRIHAMLVGINTYTGRGVDGPIRSLRGCLSDADDIERQVRRFQPASLIRLGWDASARRERPVTRQDFFRAWRDTLGAANRGDTLLLTFSGHGSQVPVAPGNPSNEPDGMDETLVLTGFDVSHGRNAEHIIDDELDQMFVQAHAKGVVVVFVADSCHSGTVYRSVDMRVQDTYRFVRAPQVDRGTLAPASPSAGPPPAPPNLLFLGGAQEDEAVPEIRDPSTGQYRGALSIAVARALEGGAATGDVITAYGLASFVLRHVQLLADGGQHADVRWPTLVTERGIDRNTRLFALADRTEPPPPTPPPAGIAPVRLRILGRSAADQQRIVAALRNAALAGEGDAAALIWDAERKLILNDQRNRIAEDVEESGLQHAVDRRLALDRLIPMAANGLEVKLFLNGRQTPASDATHKPRTIFDIAIGGIEDAHFYCLFNLTGNGQVELLEPDPGTAPDPNLQQFRNGLRKRRDRAGADISIRGVAVKPAGPFGAEHMVAVAGQFGLDRLMPALLKGNGKFAIPDVMAALASQLQVQPLKVGFRGVYTGRE
jgi:hypothetical protein